MKNENNFHSDNLISFGDRMRYLRELKGLSPIQFYDLVVAPDKQSASSEQSKYKTVYNWECGKTNVGYQEIIRMCKVLDCSSDYLLGLNECKNKDVQTVKDIIGLDEKSIKILKFWKEHYELNLKAVDEILQTSKLSKSKLDMMLNCNKGIIDKISACISCSQDSFSQERLELLSGMSQKNAMKRYRDILEYELLGAYVETSKYEAEKCFSRFLDKIAPEPEI